MGRAPALQDGQPGTTVFTRAPWVNVRRPQRGRVPLIAHEVLPNGLRVYHERRRGVPVVALWLTFGAGGADGPAPGVAHFVEHMLFKGGGGLGVGEVASRFDALGGDINAFTTHDETTVHCVLPETGLEQALQVLDAMIRACAFDPVEVERERLVIVDEILEGGDDPARLLGEAMARRMWTRHPYRDPVLGTEATVRRVERKVLVDFRDRWLVPENAVLVAVGDVAPARLMAAVHRTFGAWRSEPIERRTAVVRSRPREPDQVELRVVEIRQAFEEKLVEVAFRVPGQGHEDLPALDLLVAALGQGASALLPGRLRNRRLTHGAWAATEVGRDGGALILGFSPREEAFRPALAALGDILREVRDQGLPLDVLQRARTSILADRTFQSETAEGRASSLAWYITARGGPEAEHAYRERILGLTPSEVRETGRRYLDVTRATVGMVGPGADRAASAVDALLQRDPRHVQALRRTTTRHLRLPGDAPRVVRRVLAGGLRVLVEPDPDAPIVGVRVLALGGHLLDAPRLAGRTRAWSDLLTEGAGDLDAVAYAEAVETLAGSTRGFVSRSTMGLAAEFPAASFEGGLPLALLPFVQPRFDPDALERVTAALAEAIRTRKDDPDALAWEALWNRLAPRHPFRLPPEGTEASLARLTPGLLRQLHGTAVRADNLVVAIAGPVDPDRTCREVERRLQHLAATPFELPQHPVLPPITGRRRLRGPFAQAHVLLGFRGCRVSDPDASALEVLAMILGSQAGRLFMRLREESGLTYGATATSIEGWDPGAFVCSLATAPERLREATRALEYVLDELRARPPGEAEVERARQALTGSTLLDLQRASFRATYMAEDERFGLDGTRYRANLTQVRTVRAADVARVLAEWLAPEKAVLVQVVGEPD